MGSPALKDGDFGKDDKRLKCKAGVTYLTTVGCRESVLVSSLKCLNISVGKEHKAERKTIVYVAKKTKDYHNKL